MLHPICSGEPHQALKKTPGPPHLPGRTSSTQITPKRHPSVHPSQQPPPPSANTRLWRLWLASERLCRAPVPQSHVVTAGTQVKGLSTDTKEEKETLPEQMLSQFPISQHYCVNESWKGFLCLPGSIQSTLHGRHLYTSTLPGKGVLSYQYSQPSLWLGIPGLHAMVQLPTISMLPDLPIPSNRAGHLAFPPAPLPWRQQYFYA